MARKDRNKFNHNKNMWLKQRYDVMESETNNKALEKLRKPVKSIDPKQEVDRSMIDYLAKKYDVKKPLEIVDDESDE